MGSFPSECLTEISHIDTTLRKISLAGSVKIFAAAGVSSFAPAIIHKKVQVSRRPLTPADPERRQTVPQGAAQRMNVGR